MDRARCSSTERGLLKQPAPTREAERRRGTRGPSWPRSRARNHTPGALTFNLTVLIQAGGYSWGLSALPAWGARWHLPWAQQLRLSGPEVSIQCASLLQISELQGGVLLQRVFMAMGPELAQERRGSYKQK